MRASMGCTGWGGAASQSSSSQGAGVEEHVAEAAQLHLGRVGLAHGEAVDGARRQRSRHVWRGHLHQLHRGRRQAMLLERLEQDKPLVREAARHGHGAPGQVRHGAHGPGGVQGQGQARRQEDERDGRPIPDAEEEDGDGHPGQGADGAQELNHRTERGRGRRVQAHHHAQPEPHGDGQAEAQAHAHQRVGRVPQQQPAAQQIQHSHGQEDGLELAAGGRHGATGTAGAPAASRSARTSWSCSRW